MTSIIDTGITAGADTRQMAYDGLHRLTKVAIEGLFARDFSTPGAQSTSIPLGVTNVTMTLNGGSGGAGAIGAGQAGAPGGVPGGGGPRDLEFGYAAGNGGTGGKGRVRLEWNIGTVTYSYDPLNNLRTRGGANPLTYDANSTTNRLDSVTGGQSRTYTYNAEGQITGDGTRSFTWNGADRISSVVGVASYAYDALGKRPPGRAGRSSTRSTRAPARCCTATSRVLASPPTSSTWAACRWWNCAWRRECSPTRARKTRPRPHR